MIPPVNNTSVGQGLTALVFAGTAVALTVHYLYHRTIQQAAGSVAPALPAESVAPALLAGSVAPALPAESVAPALLAGSVAPALPAESVAPALPARPVPTILAGTISQYSPRFARRGDVACAPIAAGAAAAMLQNRIRTSADIDALVALGVLRYATISAEALRRGLGPQNYLDADMCIQLSSLRDRVAVCPYPIEWGGHTVSLTANDRADYTRLLLPMEILATQQRQPLAALMTLVPRTFALYFDPATGEYDFFDSHGPGGGGAILRHFVSREELLDYLTEHHPYVDSEEAHNPDLNRCSLHVLRLLKGG